MWDPIHFNHVQRFNSNINANIDDENINSTKDEEIQTELDPNISNATEENNILIPTTDVTDASIETRWSGILVSINFYVFNCY